MKKIYLEELEVNFEFARALRLRVQKRIDAYSLVVFRQTERRQSLSESSPPL